MARIVCGTDDDDDDDGFWDGLPSPSLDEPNS